MIDAAHKVRQIVDEARTLPELQTALTEALRDQEGLARATRGQSLRVRRQVKDDLTLIQVFASEYGVYGSECR